MTITISVAAGSEMVQFRAPRLNLTEYVPNYVILDQQTEQILALGQEAQHLALSEPLRTALEGERMTQLVIEKPFDVDMFHPKLIVKYLQYYLFLYRYRQRSGSFVDKHIRPYLTRYCCHVTIDQYDGVGWTKQQELQNELLADAGLLRLYDVTVNGRSIHTSGVSGWRWRGFP